MRLWMFVLSLNVAQLFQSSVAIAVESPSANPRDGKRAWVGVEPVGLTMAISSGARGAYFVRPDVAIEGAFGTASYEIGDMKGDKLLLEAKGKYYMGNSFYVDGGLSFEQWSADTLVEFKKVQGTATNVGLSFHLGNQWIYANNLD